jgi:hypothetical protein
MRVLRTKEKEALLRTATRGTVLLVLFFSLLAMAFSARLHQALHTDAANADHHCAVTLLASGQMDAPAIIAAVVHIPVVSTSFFQPDLPLPAGVSFNLAHGRGPPALLS